MTTQGQTSTQATSADMSVKADMPNQSMLQSNSGGKDFSDVCEVPKTELGDNVVVNRPDAGETSSFTMQPGTDYVMAFDKGAVTSMTEQNGDLTISFNCGGTLILKNYTAAIGASDPSKISFLETLGGNELATMVTTVVPATIEPSAGDAAPQSAMETIAQPQEAPQVTQPKAEDLAKAEPAAGEAAAQNVAKIEPSAGEPAGNLGGGREGYGFNSTFNTGSINGIQAVGALGATALSYGANFREAQSVPPVVNTASGPITPPDSNPNIISITGNNAAVDETNLSNGKDAVTGQVIVDFGTDGPGTITFDGSINFTGAANGQLTSCGQPINVVFDSQTNSFAGLDVYGNNVFTITINPLTGQYIFILSGVIDHADPNNPNDLINFTFGVTATDSNGNAVNTTITVGVSDDGPTVIASTTSMDETTDMGGSVSGQLDIDFGSDGAGSVNPSGSFASDTLGQQNMELTSGGVPVSVTATANGYVGVDANGNTVFTLTVQQNGSYKFELLAPLDHPNTNDPNDTLDLNFGITVTDCDGDRTQTTITINIADDGPSTRDGIISTLDESYDIGNSIDGKIGANFGVDGPGSVEGDGNFSSNVLDQNSLSLTSGGIPVTVTLTANGYVGTDANGNLVFELGIGGKGDYRFVLYRPLDHLDTNNPNDNLDLRFGVVVTDADGDRTNTTITINIADDGPSTRDGIISTLDESYDIGNSIDGKIGANFGVDGPGSVEGDGNFSSNVLDQNGLSLTSGGSPVTVTLTANGYVGTDANGNLVFELGIGGSGDYRFVLYRPLDHLDTNNPNDNLDLRFGVVVTDADGDRAHTTITINIADDGPQPFGDYTDVTDSSAPVTGNCLVDDISGSDKGLHMTSIELNGGCIFALPADGQPIMITGLYGVLTIAADGTYSYQAFPGQQGNEVFFYSIADADGDTSTTKIVFGVNTNEPTQRVIDNATVANTNEVYLSSEIQRSTNNKSESSLMTSVILAAALVDVQAEKSLAEHETAKLDAHIQTEVNIVHSTDNVQVLQAVAVNGPSEKTPVIEAETTDFTHLTSSKSEVLLFDVSDVLSVSKEEVSFDRYEQSEETVHSNADHTPVALQDDNVASVDVLYADVLHSDEFGVLHAVGSVDMTAASASETFDLSAFGDVIDWGQIDTSGTDGAQTVIDAFVTDTSEAQVIHAPSSDIVLFSGFEVSVAESAEEAIQRAQAMAA